MLKWCLSWSGARANVLQWAGLVRRLADLFTLQKSGFFLILSLRECSFSVVYGTPITHFYPSPK